MSGKPVRNKLPGFVLSFGPLFLTHEEAGRKQDKPDCGKYRKRKQPALY